MEDPRAIMRTFSELVRSLPPQQLQEIIDNMQREVDNHSTGNTPETTIDAENESPVSETANRRPSSSRGRRAQGGKRRPLNSFIAFRSYYSSIFPDLTQKVKSGILRFLWQNDPYKAKWAILARAYSTIRDDHDGRVALEPFLILNARFIGIPEPERYLPLMGWAVESDEQQQYTLAKIHEPAIPEHNAATNYSVDDIVQHCYATGYVNENARRDRGIQHGNVPVLAFAAQPTLVVQANDNIRIPGNQTPHHDDDHAMDVVTPEETAGISDSTSDDDDVHVRASPQENVQGQAVENRERGQLIPNQFDFDFGIPEWNNGSELFTWEMLLQDPMPDYDTLLPAPHDLFDVEQYIGVNPLDSVGYGGHGRPWPGADGQN